MRAWIDFFFGSPVRALWTLAGCFLAFAFFYPNLTTLMFGRSLAIIQTILITLGGFLILLHVLKGMFKSGKKKDKSH